MTTVNNVNILNALEQFYTELKSYKSLQDRLFSEKTILGHWIRERDELRENLVRTTGMLKEIIIALTGKQYFVQNDTQYDMWNEAFNQVLSTPVPSATNIIAVTFCADSTNEATGRLESDIQKGIRDEQGDLIEKPVRSTGEKDTVKLPIQLFDSMQFHLRIIEVSRELFKDKHYRDAIYRAFVEVNNFVKHKAKSQEAGRSLMSTVFRLESPIIQLNSLKTQSDKDEQEGFMFLYMGAMEGIRNPKAHENIIQDDPYKALKYLSLASLLIETAEACFRVNIPD